MTQPLRILFIEDSEDDALLISRRLKKAGYDLTTLRVDDRAGMLQALKREEWDLVLCDHSMPHFDTDSALEVIVQSRLDLPLVLVSGAIKEDNAVAFMKSGARDYVMKDNLTRLIPVIERELLSRTIREEKREAENALAAQLQFLRELIETIPAAIFYKNTEGVYQGCNTRFARWIGKNHEEEIKGRVISDFVTPSLAHLSIQKDQELIARGGHTKYETNSFDSQGKRHDFMIHKAPYTDPQGNPDGIVGVVVDITDLKQAEEARKDLEAQLRQTQKLEAIGTLAGGIAHDFNNILAAIIGYSELARQCIGSQDQIAQYLDRVLSASDRAKGLVKQILTFSRSTEQEVQSVNVATIAKEALKLLRASLPPSIDLEINLDSHAGMVAADPTQVHQVLMNLCTNSAHALKGSGGTLRVEVQRVEISEDDLINQHDMRLGAYLEIKVADTGHGMSPTTLERIFDPYFTTKAVGEGTGLGLSVVHGIVKGIGGSISVQSQRDQGTVFTLLIPVIGEESEVADTPQLTAPQGNERIMLVDDEVAMTDALSRQLRQLGYQVKTFSSGDEAWAYYQENPKQFDLVITDFLMPGMNGGKLTEKIKEISDTIPIIIHTGLDERLPDEDGKQYGADAICLKPIRGVDMARVLRELLDKYQSR